MRRTPFTRLLRHASSLPAACKPYNQLDYFKKIIRAYQGRNQDAVKYVKKVKELIDKPLDKLELWHVRLAMVKVKCARKLDISVFYRSTRRLPHEDLNDYDEGLLIHFYDTFSNESIKLLGKMVRCRTSVLYHSLDKIGKEPNADLFQFMKGPGHQRTEEEIELVFKNLGWDYSLLCGANCRVERSQGLRYLLLHCFQSFIKPLDLQPLAQCLYIWGQYINQENKVTKYSSMKISYTGNYLIFVN